MFRNMAIETTVCYFYKYPYMLMRNSIRTLFVAIVELDEEISGLSLGDADVAGTTAETFQEYFPAAVEASAAAGAAPILVDLESGVDTVKNSPLRESTHKKKNSDLHHEQWVGKLVAMELSEGVDQLWCNSEKSSEYTNSCSQSTHPVFHFLISHSRFCSPFAIQL
ncbi:MAG TPA: hypothetical protein VGD33_06780 [Chitinophagaceae bacterium]